MYRVQSSMCVCACVYRASLHIPPIRAAFARRRCIRSTTDVSPWTHFLDTARTSNTKHKKSIYSSCYILLLRPFRELLKASKRRRLLLDSLMMKTIIYSRHIFRFINRPKFLTVRPFRVLFFSPHAFFFFLSAFPSIYRTHAGDIQPKGHPSCSSLPCFSLRGCFVSSAIYPRRTLNARFVSPLYVPFFSYSYSSIFHHSRVRADISPSRSSRTRYTTFNLRIMVFFLFPPLPPPPPRRPSPRCFLVVISGKLLSLNSHTPRNAEYPSHTTLFIFARVCRLFSSHFFPTNLFSKSLLPVLP